MPDYLTPGYRNTDEGRPVWKRPAFLIIAALIVLTVVGAAYFLSGEETDGSSGSGNSDGGHTTDERRRSAGLSRSQTAASSRPSSTSRITTEATVNSVTAATVLLGDNRTGVDVLGFTVHRTPMDQSVDRRSRSPSSWVVIPSNPSASTRGGAAWLAEFGGAVGRGGLYVVR